MWDARNKILHGEDAKEQADRFRAKLITQVKALYQHTDRKYVPITDNTFKKPILQRLKQSTRGLEISVKFAENRLGYLDRSTKAPQ